MPKPYRSKGRVVMDILGAIQREGPVGVTRLLTVANLTHGRIQEHLGLLEQNGLVAQADGGERSGWVITEKGNQALQELLRVDRAMRDFGIDL
jgi:predicted transcriptional regulator